MLDVKIQSARMQTSNLRKASFVGEHTSISPSLEAVSMEVGVTNTGEYQIKICYLSSATNRLPGAALRQSRSKTSRTSVMGISH